MQPTRIKSSEQSKEILDIQMKWARFLDHQILQNSMNKSISWYIVRKAIQFQERLPIFV
jgi:hypothetical protein